MGCGGGSSSTPAPTPTPVASATQVSWLQKATVPLASVDPTAPATDLAFLGDVVGNASIIGLGEASHGSSEFQTMKHRLFQYLVEQKGITAFGLEAQMGRCLALDQYVQTGQGDPTQALIGQGFWVWSTQEMLDLVNWMQAYNANPAHTAKLHFFGFDMQDGGDEMDQVLAYLLPIDPQANATLTQLYAPYRPYTWDGGMASYPAATAAVQAQCHANIQQAYQWMVNQQAAYSAATGAAAYAWALQMATVVVQNEAFNAAGTSGMTFQNLRDQSMASNANWYFQQMGAGAKVVLSAHNEHINKKGLYSDWTNFGDWLEQTNGTDYFSLGFGFDSGSFNAVLVNADGTFGALQANTATPAASNSYECAFTQAGQPMAFMDMRNLDTTQPGPAWFSQGMDLREVGAAWNPATGFCVNFTQLPTRFDAFIFLQTITPSTFLSRTGKGASSN
jgi:erythromycin esterase